MLNFGGHCHWAVLLLIWFFSSRARIMRSRHFGLIAGLAVSGGLAASARAAVLFSDDFNVNSSGAWTVNVAPSTRGAAQSAEFAYDYAAFGIPPAPGSLDTLG